MWHKSATTAVVMLCAIGSLATIYTATQTVIPYREIRDDMVLDNHIERLTDADKRSDTDIGIDIDTTAVNAFVDYRYLVHPIQVLPIDNGDTVPRDVNCVISTDTKPPAETGWTDQGAEPVLDLTLWMREGLDSC
jgi:hypothetical protein